MILHAKEYPLRSTIPLVIVSLLVGVWVLSGVPFMMSSPSITNDHRSQSLRVGSCCVALAQAIFASIYADIGLSRRTGRIAHATVILQSCLCGIFIVATFGGWDDAMSIGGSTEHIHPSYSPFVSVISMTGTALLCALLFSFSADQKQLSSSALTDNELRLNGLSIFFILLGSVLVLLIILASALELGSPRYSFVVCTIVARFFISIGFLFVALGIARDPLFITITKGCTRGLMSRGVVGWTLTSMQDIGPVVVSDSELFNEKNGISDMDLMTLSVASLTAVGIGKSFRDASYVLPFPYHEELVAVSSSFRHHESEVKDEATESGVSCVFSVLLPSILLPRIGQISRVHQVVKEFKNLSPTISTLAEEEKMKELAQRVLAVMI